ADLAPAVGARGVLELRAAARHRRGARLPAADRAGQAQDPRREPRAPARHRRGGEEERAGSAVITDVPGVEVGHATDDEHLTGCPVVLWRDGATAGVAVRGAAPGTRETDLCRPGTLIERVHAVLLTGGSAFGLEAAAGVMRHLARQGVGYDARGVRVP